MQVMPFPDARMPGESCVGGLEEFSLEMLCCGAKETFKNKYLAGRAVVWAGDKDMGVRNVDMKTTALKIIWENS